jgi:hypothetical protein
VVFRVLRVLVGAFIGFANSLGEGTLLGFYPLDSGERVGFDLAKAAIYWLAGWLIYRGFKPAIKHPVTPIQD